MTPEFTCGCGEQPAGRGRLVLERALVASHHLGAVGAQHEADPVGDRARLVLLAHLLLGRRRRLVAERFRHLDRPGGAVAGTIHVVLYTPSGPDFP